ncbi:MAG: hypothetical protein HYX41_00725 [Bdellovibrio sp.]|nr:hypothetical protein [Bdellovibrio sp.]
MRFSLPALIISGLSLGISVSTGCKEPDKTVPLIYSVKVPKSRKLNAELEQLEQSHRLQSADRRAIEQELSFIQRGLGVPEGLLWCLIYTKSQLDHTKNMNSTSATKGLGQLNEIALAEFNHDRDFYDPRTSTFFKRHLRLGDSLVNFSINDLPTLAAESPATLDSENTREPSSTALSGQEPQNITLNRVQNTELNADSYFRIPVGVVTTASYLNNRYLQLRSALDHLGIAYDPVILWFFAAAAYEGGTRSVFTVLTHELISRGEKNLSHILSDMETAKTFLTQKENLEYPISTLSGPDSPRGLASESESSKKIQSITRTMENIMSCLLPEAKVL